MNYARKAFDWLLLAPALLPLVFVDGLIYPFTTPKTLLLWSFGILLLALFVFLAGSGEAFYWARLKNKFTWLPGALLVVAYITSLLGVDFYRSFWSIWARGDGLLTLTVIMGFFYFILLRADKKFFITLCKMLAWVGSVAALYGALEWLKVVTGINLPVVADTGARVGGTLDNAAFLAGYLSLTLFVTLAVLPEYANKWRTVLYCGAGLQLIAILLTATRGSMLALGVALAAVLAYMAWKGNTYRQYARWTLIALVVLGGLFFMVRGQLARVPIAPVQRLASISLQDATVSSRLFIWQQVGALALQRPLTGYGAEQISGLFDKVYDPSKIIEQWFDRTHNSFLDYLVQYGVFGLLLYIAVVLRVGYVGRRLFARGERRGAYLFLIALVYAVQDFFVFDTSMTLWTLFALFAAGEVLLADSSASPTPVSALPGAKIIGGVIGVAALLLLIPAVIEPLRANLALADAYANHVSNVNQYVSSMQQGFALGTYGDLEFGYEAYSMYTGDQLPALTGADAVKAYTEAEAVLEADYNRYPYDARTATYLAHVLSSVPQGVEVDQAKLGQVLDRAIALSPKRSQPWYLKANIFIAQGDNAKTSAAKQEAYAQALDILKQYSAQVPALAEPRYVIASLYLTLGDKASAKEWADGALAVYTTDAATAQRAVKYYLAIEDWPHAERFLEDVVNANPDNYDALYDLAKVSYLAGDKDKALAIVARLRQAKPGFVESDPAFLQAIGQH